MTDKDFMPDKDQTNAGLMHIVIEHIIAAKSSVNECSLT
jgi:hypothetical protein